MTLNLKKKYVSACPYLKVFFNKKKISETYKTVVLIYTWLIKTKESLQKLIYLILTSVILMLRRDNPPYLSVNIAHEEILITCMTSLCCYAFYKSNLNWVLALDIFCHKNKCSLKGILLKKSSWCALFLSHMNIICYCYVQNKDNASLSLK